MIKIYALPYVGPEPLIRMDAGVKSTLLRRLRDYICLLHPSRSELIFYGYPEADNHVMFLSINLKTLKNMRSVDGIEYFLLRENKIS